MILNLQNRLLSNGQMVCIGYGVAGNPVNRGKLEIWVEERVRGSYFTFCEFRGHDTQLKTCKRCSRKLEGFEVDVVNVSPAVELADISSGSSVLRISMIFVPSEFTEELGAMDLPGFGL